MHEKECKIHTIQLGKPKISTNQAKAQIPKKKESKKPNIFFGITVFIIWQGKSERSDWFFLGRDFAIRTVSVETVISCVFFVFESQQTQNKHGASVI